MLIKGTKHSVDLPKYKTNISTERCFLLLIGRIRGNWVSKSGNNFGNWEFIYIFNHYMMASFVGFLHKERERESKIESQRMDRKISMIDRYGRLSRQRRKPPYSCVEHLTVG